jgi:hypothetical protein
MLNDLPVLVAEAENFSAMAFVMTVEDLNGRAVGPAASVSVAMALLQSREIGAAIVDWIWKIVTRCPWHGSFERGRSRSFFTQAGGSLWSSRTDIRRSRLS